MHAELSSWPCKLLLLLLLLLFNSNAWQQLTCVVFSAILSFCQNICPRMRQNAPALTPNAAALPHLQHSAHEGQPV